MQKKLQNYYQDHIFFIIELASFIINGNKKAATSICIRFFLIFFHIYVNVQN